MSSTNNESESTNWPQIYRELSNGNPNAEDLLLSWSNLCHLLDDIVDQDKVLDPEAIIRTVLAWTLSVSVNPFYRDNAAGLNSLVIASFSSYLDSVRMEKSADPGQRQFGDALRSFYVEFAFYVACLAGGYEHQREMSRKYREACYYSQRPRQIDGQLPDLPAPDLVEKAQSFEDGAGSGKPARQMAVHKIKTEAEWVRLEQYAASFERPHGIDRRFEYWVVRPIDEDRWVGYVCVLCAPPPGSQATGVGITAWKGRKAECVKGMETLTSWGILNYGKLATLIPMDSPLLPHMEKMGYVDWGMKLYVTQA